VIDHGSTDGSTENLPEGVNLIKLKRADLPNYQRDRVTFVANLIQQLRATYEIVGYSDADELIILDPRVGLSLRDYLIKNKLEVFNAIGFEVIHDIDNENKLDERFVGLQRKWLKFNPALCKPIFSSKEIKWDVGYHFCSFKPHFSDLYLMHLRYTDLDEGTSRLKLTRTLDRPDLGPGRIDHHKISDNSYESWIRFWLSHPQISGEIGLSNPLIKSRIDQLTASTYLDNSFFKFDYNQSLDNIFEIPSYIKNEF
jgi:hypothetical protein